MSMAMCHDLEVCKQTKNLAADHEVLLTRRFFSQIKVNCKSVTKTLFHIYTSSDVNHSGQKRKEQKQTSF